MSIVDKTKESHEKIIKILPMIDHHIMKKDTQIPIPSFRFIQNPFRKVERTKYCYATMLFLGDKYVPSALVLGESLRKSGVKQNIVCFVQGINDDVKSDLFRVFDYIVECELLEVNGYKEPKEFHFTKKKTLSSNFKICNKIEYFRI